jgi:hypothetical protein
MKNRQTKKNQKNISLPVHVRIGYRDYDIYYDEKVADEKNETLEGFLDVNCDEIHIRNMKKNAMQITMLHEIIHGIDDFVSLGLEENQVEVLASVLIDTIDRNPKVKQFIFG